jgi:hypothetical protein
MAGDEHIRFQPEVNYVYNRANPISDRIVRPLQQARNEQIIRAMPAYRLLEA